MTAGVWFWLIFVISVLFGFVSNYPGSPDHVRGYWPLGGSLLVFVLLAILGYACFGGPMK